MSLGAPNRHPDGAPAAHNAAYSCAGRAFSYRSRRYAFTFLKKEEKKNILHQNNRMTFTTRLFLSRTVSEWVHRCEFGQEGAHFGLGTVLLHITGQNNKCQKIARKSDCRFVVPLPVSEIVPLAEIVDFLMESRNRLKLPCCFNHFDYTAYWAPVSLETDREKSLLRMWFETFRWKIVNMVNIGGSAEWCFGNGNYPCFKDRFSGTCTLALSLVMC